MKKYLNVSAFVFVVLAITMIIMCMFYLIDWLKSLPPKWMWVTLLIATSNLIMAGFIKLFFWYEKE